MNGTHIQTIPFQPIALEDTLSSCADIFLFLSITMLSIKRLALSSKVNPDQLCVPILHVQTRASNIDVYCWIVVVSGSDVPISVVSTVVSGLMVVSIIVVCDRCVAIVDISISGTTSESCDVVWKFDDVGVFAIIDDIHMYIHQWHYMLFGYNNSLEFLKHKYELYINKIIRLHYII